MRSLYFASVLLFCSVAAFSQTATGVITGTISDPAGAVIASVPLELINSQTGAAYRSATSETGNYTFSQLPVGTYELKVNVTGFKSYVRQNLGVQSAQTIRVDVVLEVGTSAESVTVTAQASMLKTESAEVSMNVTTSRLNSLPILGVGPQTASTHGVRNPLAGSLLSAGVFFVPNALMKVNGAPSNTFGIKLDGQDITNGVNTSASQAQMQPSVDSLEEVAVQASNYAAEFGQAGSGLFQFTTKSGTNDWHGSVYDYFINEALWAHQPYANNNGQRNRNRNRRNDYGGTLGGPVWIPKIYDGHNRTFFFFGYEEFREKNISSDQIKTVPTLAYREGNFATALTGRAFTGANAVDGLGNPMLEGMIFDPTTERLASNGTRARLQFPGNQIPAGRFDSSALKLQNIIPKPNHGAPNALVNNFLNPFSSDRVTPIPSIKVDHSFNDRIKASVYASGTSTSVLYSPGGFSLSEGFPDEITRTRGTFIESRTYRANLDYTVQPTMLLHFGAGYVVNDFKDTAPITNFDMVGVLGIRGGTVGPANGARVPVFSSMIGAQGTGGMEPMGPGIGQVRNLLQRPTGNISLSWVKSNHTYKFGGEIRFDGYPGATFTNTSGNFSITTEQTTNTFFQGQTAQSLGGRFAGFAYASLLLGRVNQVTLAQPTNTRGGRGFYTWFAQDTWKVTRKLTLDYGIRWDLFTYPREQFGRSPSFSPDVPNPTAGGHLGATIYEATCNCRFANNYPYGYAPRIGVAYQIDTKTVFRAGAGINYSMSQGGGQGAAGANQSLASPNFGDEAMILSNGIPLTPIWPDLRPGLFPTPNTTTGAPPVVDQNYGRPARMYQWSIGLQREVIRDLVVEASYVGNRGVWWRTGSLVDYNALRPEILKSVYGLDWANSATDRALLTRNVNSALAGPFQNRRPYSSFPTAATVAQSLRPFPQFGNLGAIGPAMGKTWFDSLQVKATKRFSHGLDFTWNYTFSKELQLGAESDTGGGLINDVFNRDSNKQLSSASRPHWMVMAANYTLPKWGFNRWVDFAVADWTIGAVLQYGSGMPFAVPLNTSNNNGATLLRGASWSQRVPGQPLFLQDLNCHCFDPSQTRVLNPDAWTDTPSGQFSTSAAFYNDFRQQRRPSELLSAGRIFRIKESMTLLIRAEFNNAFNRTQIPTPSTTRAAAFTQAPDGRNLTGFGTINTTGTVSGERQGTLVARLQF